MASVVLVSALAVSGCSGDEPEPDSTPTATTSETLDPRAAAEAEIIGVYHDWWDAVVDATNTGSVEAGPFEGVAENVAIEQQLTVVRRLNDQGITRQGEPEIYEPAVTALDGDTARVEGCVDEANWTSTQNDVALPADTRGPTARVFDLVRLDEGWIVANSVPQQEATIKC